MFSQIEAVGRCGDLGDCGVCVALWESLVLSAVDPGITGHDDTELDVEKMLEKLRKTKLQDGKLYRTRVVTLNYTYFTNIEAVAHLAGEFYWPASYQSRRRKSRI